MGDDVEGLPELRTWGFGPLAKRDAVDELGDEKARLVVRTGVEDGDDFRGAADSPQA